MTSIENQELDVNSESRTTIQRGKHDREHPYVQISRKMLRDPSISPKAKGVLCYLLSLPDNWKAHPRHVALSMGVGKDQIYNILKELIKAGYATRTEVKRDKGQFNTVIYEFYEDKLEPILNEIKENITLSGNPDAGFPDAGMQTLRKKEDKKDIKEEDTPIPPKKENAASAAGVGVFTSKKSKKKKDPTEQARELFPKFIKVIKDFKPTYVVKEPQDILEWLDVMLSDGRSQEEILRVFAWGVNDNVIRGNWGGWSSKLIRTNPAKYLCEKFEQIDTASSATNGVSGDRRPKDKYGNPIVSEFEENLF